MQEDIQLAAAVRMSKLEHRKRPRSKFIDDEVSDDSAPPHRRRQVIGGVIIELSSSEDESDDEEESFIDDRPLSQISIQESSDSE